jgi:hypothetical protein
MNRILAFVAVCAAAVFATSALAQVPALEGASPAEKARITALIQAAKGEGAITYWDVVIQPETNEALTTEFRKYYGLPESFKVNYQLLATAALVPASGVGADKVTAMLQRLALVRSLGAPARYFFCPEYDSNSTSITPGESRLGKKGFCL